MLCCLNPSHLTYEDSHNTLKYANRAKNIRVNPVARETSRDCSWVEREQRLIEENTRLRARVQELERLVFSLRAGAGGAEEPEADAEAEAGDGPAAAADDDMVATEPETAAVEAPAVVETAPAGRGRRASLKRPRSDDAAAAQVCEELALPEQLAQEDDFVQDLAPRDLKALKRRRQSAIPTFSARGGGGGRASILPSEPLFELPEQPEEDADEVAMPVPPVAAAEPINEPEPIFDLGTALTDAPPPPTTRSNRRQSAAVGSKLASNRRKSMAAINTMLDTLSSIGLAAPAADEDGDPALAVAAASDPDVGRITRRKSMLMAKGGSGADGRRRASVGGLGMEAWSET